MQSINISVILCFGMIIVIQVSSKTPKKEDIYFPSGNTSVLFSNATFSPSDAIISIPGALLLERGNNCTYTKCKSMLTCQ